MTTADVVFPREVFKCRKVGEHVSRGSSVISESTTPETAVVRAEETGKNFGNCEENSKTLNSTAKSSSFDSSMNIQSRLMFSKRRNNRHRKRKWKPYLKLTWDEKKKLDKRESKRAHKIREEMSAKGITLAPYNTTQFLMEDHNLQGPDLEVARGHRRRENSNSENYSDNDEVWYSSPEEEDYLHREFVQIYENIHAERLNTMTLEELVEEYMDLEEKVDNLERDLEENRDQPPVEVERTIPTSPFDVEAENEKIRVFREEIEKLSLENDNLEKQNEIMRLQLATR